MGHRHTATKTVVAFALSALISATVVIGVVEPPAKVTAAPEAKPAAVAPVPPAPHPELAEAQALLDAQIREHDLLKGTTIEIGDARGYEAIALYRQGRIIVSASHDVGLERIIAHEVWHVIDWRDNGRIDWGEDVPPGS